MKVLKPGTLRLPCVGVLNRERENENSRPTPFCNPNKHRNKSLCLRNTNWLSSRQKLSNGGSVGSSLAPRFRTLALGMRGGAWGLKNDLALSVLVLECRRVSALRGRKASGASGTAYCLQPYRQTTQTASTSNLPKHFGLRRHDGSSLAALNSTSRGSECFFDKGRFRCRFVFFLVGSFSLEFPFRRGPNKNIRHKAFCQNGA